MSDDKTRTGGQDQTRINVDEDHELRAWSKKFGVSAQEVKNAVAAVGDDAARVQDYLRRTES